MRKQYSVHMLPFSAQIDLREILSVHNEKHIQDIKIQYFFSRIIDKII